MKKIAYFCISALALCSTFAAATPQTITDQNNHYRAQQKRSEVKRQDNNRSVNRNIQQQRYNATRPTTRATYRSPPPRTYTTRTTPTRTTTTYKRK